MSSESNESNTAANQFTRRELFPLAGKVAIGTAGLAAVSSASLAFGCGQGTEAEGHDGGSHMAAEVEHDWPWPYEMIDPEEAAALAYDNWYEKFCCYAVTSSILIPLQEKIGAPYTHFPVASTKWGHGGAVGWGTLCGTLTGVGIATGLIAGDEGERILNDVINWYARTELPIYVPAEPKTGIASISTSDSPLCHISVGKWMKEENVQFFSDARKERCARLSADVAIKTVELLNQWAGHSYTPVYGEQAKVHHVQMTAQNNCTECHGDAVPASPGA
ncbi:MAG: C_GCAxxG_C_C family protein [Thermoleophilia bacterium]|nr:C_GCAxxG_C_C family protein [Thermoleophilia bacterium]